LPFLQPREIEQIEQSKQIEQSGVNLVERDVMFLFVPLPNVPLNMPVLVGRLAAPEAPVRVQAPPRPGVGPASPEQTVRRQVRLPGPDFDEPALPSPAPPPVESSEASPLPGVDFGDERAPMKRLPSADIESPWGPMKPMPSDDIESPWATPSGWLPSSDIESPWPAAEPTQAEVAPDVEPPWVLPGPPAGGAVRPLPLPRVAVRTRPAPRLPAFDVIDEPAAGPRTR
jgi:hypothetical protein